MARKMPKQYCDWSSYSSDASVRRVSSRKLEQSFWRFYDDLSRKFLTVLRYTICLPFFFKFPDNNIKVTKPNDNEYGDSRKSRKYKSRYQRSFRSRSPSSHLSDTTRTSDCSDMPAGDDEKRRNPQYGKKPLFRKLFYRRRRRPRQLHNENLENSIVFIKNKNIGELEPMKPVMSVDEYSVTSSLDDLPNVYNDFGDGPQNKERLRRITDFFNDIYIEQQKLLMKT